MPGEPPWRCHQWMPKYVKVKISMWFNIYNTEHRNILKHDQQDATLYNTLHYCQRSTRFEFFFSNLFAVTASGNSKQVWQIPDAACTALSSWWWAEKTLETCRALKITKSITQRCILLVMLKNTLTMHGPMNVKFEHRNLVLIIGVRDNDVACVRHQD
jgi:hypothetical protein